MGVLDGLCNGCSNPMDTSKDHIGIDTLVQLNETGSDSSENESNSSLSSHSTKSKRFPFSLKCPGSGKSDATFDSNADERLAGVQVGVRTLAKSRVDSLRRDAT